MIELATFGTPAWTARGEVTSLRWLDDRRFVAADARGLAVFDALTRELVAVGPDDDPIRLFRWPGGQVLYCARPAPVLWDPVSGARRELPAALPWGFYGADPSPDGRLLALGGNGALAAVVDASTGEAVWHRAVGDREIIAIAWSRDGEWIALGTGGGTLHVVDAATGETLHRSEPFGFNHEDLVLSRDGRRLIVTAERGVWLLDTATFAPIWSSEVADLPLGAAWSRGEEHVLALTSSGNLARLRASDGERVEVRLRNWSNPALSPDGARMVVASGPRLGLIDVSSDDPARWRLDPRDDREDRQLLAFAADGEALHHGPVRIRIRDGREEPSPMGQAVRPQVSERGAVTWIDGDRTRWAPDPDHAEAKAFDGIEPMWFDSAGRPVARRTERGIERTDELGRPDGRRYTGRAGLECAVSPDGQRLALKAWGAGWQIRDRERGRLLTRARRAESYRLCWAGRRIVMDHPSADAGLVVVDPDTLEVLRPLAPPHSGYTLFASADGRWVALRDQRQVAIWDVATGQLLAVLSRDRDVAGAAFSPDGRRIAISFEDLTATVWELP